MAEYHRESDPGETREQLSLGLAPGMKGWLWGMMFWLSMFLVVELAREIGSLFPEWFSNLFVFEILFTICAFLAAPIAAIGWLFIWGDNGPPNEWLNSTAFHVGFALIFYGLIGARIGRWIGKRRNTPR